MKYILAFLILVAGVCLLFLIGWGVSHLVLGGKISTPGEDILVGAVTVATLLAIGVSVWGVAQLL